MGEETSRQEQGEDVAISTEVAALAALAFADLPPQAWAHIEVKGYLPHIVSSLRQHLDGASWEAVSYPDVCDVVLRVIEQLEIEAADEDSSTGGPPEWAKGARGNGRRSPIPVGAMPFPAPIGASDERARERVEMLTGRALTPAYQEGVARLRQKIMMQRIEAIVGEWQTENLDAGEAMQRVAEAVTRPAT